MLTTSFSCNLLEPKKNSSNVQLSAADVICTEVWLKLSFADSQNGGEYRINRDGNVVLSGSFAGTDTVIVDTTVQPSKSYSYTAYRLSNGNSAEASSTLQVTTLDSTSSNFSWQLYNFGNFNATGNASTLYSVAVINDTNVWAVGEIYIPDSVGKYNAIRWDGIKWSQTNIYYNYQGQNVWGTLRSIFAINENDIWFGGNVHWNGNIFQDFPIDPVLLGNGVDNMWGNSNGIYVIGNGGFIAFRNLSGTWQKVTSGTSLDLYDIYSSNGKEIYVGGGKLQTYDGILLKGNANGFQTVEEGKNLPNLSSQFHPYFDGVAKTVWVSNVGTVYFGGDGFYIYTGGETNEVRTLQGNRGNADINGQYFGFISQVRGLAENQMILVGEKNTIRYFNGVRWTQLGMPYDPNSGYTWLSVGMTNDLIVVVGYSISGGAVNGGTVMMLKRQ